MAYIDIYNAAIVIGNLRKQVAVAMVKAAIDVRNESIATPNHIPRYDWANYVLRNGDEPINEASKWIWKVLENATIQAAPETALDSDVQFVINSLVNTFAGVSV